MAEKVEPHEAKERQATAAVERHALHDEQGRRVNEARGRSETVDRELYSKT